MKKPVPYKLTIRLINLIPIYLWTENEKLSMVTKCTARKWIVAMDHRVV